MLYFCQTDSCRRTLLCICGVTRSQVSLAFLPNAAPLSRNHPLRPPQFNPTGAPGMKTWLIVLAVCLSCLPAVGKTDNSTNIVDSSACRFTINQIQKKNCPDLIRYNEGQTIVTVSLLLETKAGYSWRAVLFSTRSPYVEILSVDDLNSVPHTFIVTETGNIESRTEDRCKNLAKIEFKFPNMSNGLGFLPTRLPSTCPL
jgi:hypothetical protein